MHYTRENQKKYQTIFFYTVGYFNILCWDGFIEHVTLKNTNNIHTSIIK